MAPSGAPVWRKDVTKGDVFTLTLTAKGLKAIAVASEGGQRTGKPTVPGGAEKQCRNRQRGDRRVPSARSR
jgi:hypothetical protein